MFKISLIFFVIIISIIISKEDCDSSIKIINDDFTYINYNDTIKKLSIYFGNELKFLVFTLPENIYFENDFIVFNKSDSKLNFSINYTKAYYCKDKKFLFVDSVDNNKNVTIVINNTNRELEVDSFIYGTINYNFSDANIESFIIENNWLSYLLILAGCLISSYGAYHSLKSLVMHSGFLIYVIIGDVINFFSEFENYIHLFLAGTFLISISVSLFLRTGNKKQKKSESQIKSNNDVLEKLNLSDDEKNTNTPPSKKKVIVNCLYGATFGLAVYKTFIYYAIYFGLSPNFSEKETERFFIYFIGLMLLVTAGIFLNLFDIFKKYRYLPCSAVAGSFYIIKGVEYLLGGYYSSILFIKSNLEFKLKDEKRLEISLTYFLIQMIIIIYSILFQIKYIQFKEKSIFEPQSNRDSNVNNTARPSNLSVNDSQGAEESLMGKNMQDDNENEDNEINDQED